MSKKNRDVKKYGKVSHQRINLPWSLLSKQVMKYNKFIQEHLNGFPNLFEHERKLKMVNYDDLKQKYNFNCDFFEANDTLFALCWLKYKSTLFKPGHYIALNKNVIKCYLIREIIRKNSDYYFIIEEYQTSDYDEHKLCYNVEISLENFEIQKVEDFEYFPFNLHKTIDKCNSFRLKYL